MTIVAVELVFVAIHVEWLLGPLLWLLLLISHADWPVEPLLRMAPASDCFVNGICDSADSRQAWSAITTDGIGDDEKLPALCAVPVC